MNFADALCVDYVSLQTSIFYLIEELSKFDLLFFLSQSSEFMLVCLLIKRVKRGILLYKSVVPCIKVEGYNILTAKNRVFFHNKPKISFLDNCPAMSFYLCNS